MYVCRLLLLRLVSSEESRVLDSLQAFCSRLSSLCRAKVSEGGSIRNVRTWKLRVNKSEKEDCP